MDLILLIMKKPKLIAISEKNYQRLVNYGKMNQSFDQVIDQILNEIVIK
jgi:predicted CopG family antitoxin